MPAPHVSTPPVTPPPTEPAAPEFPEPTLRRQPTALPPATPRLELPRSEPTRALELPPLDDSGSLEPVRSDVDRTEPGTWREIIARFERELGPVTEPDENAADTVVPAKGTAEAEAPDAGVFPAASEAADAETLSAAEAAEVEVAEAEVAAAETAEAETAEAEAADAEAPVTETGLPIEGAEPASVDAKLPFAEPADPGATVEPGEPPLLDEPVPWEFEAMTTPDYSPPQSIHDAGHDSWPVETEDGDAVPAWSDEAVEQEADEAGEPFDDIGELLLDEVVPADPWDREPEADEPDTTSDFPLDAFIVPAGVQTVSGYGEEDVARRVALRLDEIARELRDSGLRSLGSTD
ncbi:MAG TPA: hypothetical protein VHG09_12575, partial [Longimicrobiales bacterium]|nr:hypothetical protein [Longimicrobiales bacterium]